MLRVLSALAFLGVGLDILVPWQFWLLGVPFLNGRAFLGVERCVS